MINESSPRPWSINPDYLAYERADTMGKAPPLILDANGDPVLETSEWITIKQADLNLIVKAVNENAN
jgi:hypothetical protein